MRCLSFFKKVKFPKGKMKKRGKKGLLSSENEIYLQLLHSGTSCQQPASPLLLMASLASSQTTLCPTGQTSIQYIARSGNGNGKQACAAEIWRARTRVTQRGGEGRWGSRRPRGELDHWSAEERRAAKNNSGWGTKGHPEGIMSPVTFGVVSQLL